MSTTLETERNQTVRGYVETLASNWCLDSDFDDDDSDRWGSTADWFETEAMRYDAMASDLGAFMARKVRSIASEFAMLDAESPSVFEARSEVMMESL